MKTPSLCLVVVLCSLIGQTALAQKPKINCKLDYWNVQRKGANGDGGANKNSGTTPEAWFAAAEKAGLDFVRLIPHLWPGEGRDFLLGNADNFTAIPEKDLALLLSVLDTAYQHHINIELSMFSLPGARNRQDNNNAFDYRLWNSEKYQQQAQVFWRSLADALKDHPAVVAYNPLNEPHPGRQHGVYEAGSNAFSNWLGNVAGTSADLNRFNQNIVRSIRERDSDTPIVLNGWMHASAEGLSHLQPVNDKATIYAFHYYGDWQYATYRINQNRFSYPDRMPLSGQQKDTSVKWTRSHIALDLQTVANWAQQHEIPENRIMVEEFGADRRVGGVVDFLGDTLKAMNDKNWHWAFYSFRSSSWDGMDYELGTQKLGWRYWQKRDQGLSHEQLIQRDNNPLWQVFKNELNNREKDTACRR